MTDISPRHIDALTEIINIGVGRAASIINEMVGHHVSLRVPFVKLVRPEDLAREIGYEGNSEFSSVQMPFEGALHGVASLIFPPESASKLVAVLTGEESDSLDLDSIKVETLNEVGNIVLNSVIGSIGNLLEQRFEYSIPSYMEGVFNEIFLSAGASNPIIMIAKADFLIMEHNIRGDIMIIFEVNSFDSVLLAIESSF
ncbi:MAG: chemotaxis protein CheX [Nitrospinae bacterium]|nr:chemotaxis protein CheX [Nitrospinota bacterium]